MLSLKTHGAWQTELVFVLGNITTGGIYLCNNGYVCFFIPAVAPCSALEYHVPASESPAFLCLSTMRMIKMIFSYFSVVGAP